MKRKYQILILMLIIYSTLCRCDSTEDLPELSYTPYYVIESLLVTNKPFSEIHFSITASPLPSIDIFVNYGIDYNYSDQVITTASIKIDEITDEGETIQTINYQYDTLSLTYQPIFDKQIDSIVKPKTNYKLLIQVYDDTQKENLLISSEIKTPDDISIKNLSPSTTYRYNGENVSYQISLNDNDLDIFNGLMHHVITPRNAKYIPSDAASIGDSYYTDSSYIYQSYQIEEIINNAPMDNNTYILEIPWGSFGYYGKNTVTIELASPQYILSLSGAILQTAFTTLSTGEYYNLPSNVNNAIGYFESISQASGDVYIVE